MPPHQSRISNRIGNAEIVSAYSKNIQRLEFAQIILDSLTQFSGLLDESGTVLQINLKSLEAAGVSQSQVEGFPFWETIWWQNSTEAKQQLQDAITRAASGEIVRYAAQISSGSEAKPIPIELSLTPLQDESGNVAFLCFEGRTVFQQGLMPETDRGEMDTALAQQRRLYEAILTNTPDLAYVFDPQHRFIYINEGLLKMWGKSWNEAIGKTCLELGYEPWHAAMHDREIDQVIATREPIRGEVPFTGTFGRRIYDYIFVPVFGPDGSVEAVAGTTRDVTDRKEADRRKDEFLATLAHELRNPLAPIRNAVQILAMRTPSDAIAERAQGVIERQVQHMVRLIDDLLDVGRITSGKLELQRECVDLRSALDQAVESSRPFIERARHRLSLQVPNAPILLHADPVRLAQILANLLTNAAKYTDPGGEISVEARVEGDEVLVAVRDTGVGIDAEHLPRVFDMFSQIAPSHTRSDGGLGIGLALVKGLVEMHGGQITAESAGAGRGSVFTVSLPLAAAGAAEAAVVTHGDRDAPPTRSILVVDDNVDSAESLAELLRIYGSAVETAHDGEQALATADRLRPDVVLLDLGLPKVDGYEVCRRIREQPWARRTMIIAQTGWGGERDREKTLLAGFDAHLVKPVDPDQLLELLANASENLK